MLHTAETWAVTEATLNHLQHNDHAMICNVKAKDEVNSDSDSHSLLSKLGIQDLDVVLHTSRMRWFGHIECCTGWIAEIRVKCSCIEEAWQAKENVG